MEYKLYLPWNDSNSIGIPIIDEQHRSIVSVINSLHYFVQKHRELDVLESTIKTMSEYTAIHFMTEEMMLKEAGYSSIEEHILLHRQLIKQLQTVSQEAMHDRDVDPLLKFLKAWWINHINHEDRKYVPFMSSKR
jgi:hemerythrin